MNPTAHCDICHVSADLLETSSALSAFIEYFRCPHCGLVWTQPKLGFDGQRQVITVQDQNQNPGAG